MIRTSSYWSLRHRTAVLGLVFLGTVGAMTTPAWAAKPADRSRQDDPPTRMASATDDKQAEGRVVSLTLKQLGAWSSLKLRGVDGSQSIPFSVRADEVVVGARLRVGYDYSPSLLPDLSHFRVLLNERVVAVESLPQGKNVGNTRDIVLDPRLFSESNELRFNLIGHYTRQCEDPFHTSLWLTVSDLSRLELTLAPLSGGSDLRNLPAPFLDIRDTAALRLPFVFAASPGRQTHQAAGVVASWFGIQAGSRNAQFPVLLGNLPPGNAVVLLQGAESIGNLRATADATVSIVPHPNNPNARLLLVSGGDEGELLRAARALALIAPTMVGQAVTITKEVPAPARRPYDAPAWVPVDRPVRIGELARPNELRAQGYYPGVIRVNFRVPPDVFAWRTPGAPLDLKYRTSRLPEQKNASLAVSLNASFVDNLTLFDSTVARASSTPLIKSGQNPSVRSTSLYLPPYEIGGRDQLQFAYSFDVLKEGECKNIPPDNLQGAVDAESTIDFSSFPKYAVLPNLGYFTDIGYPFTRMADLSETAVVLPAKPDSEELSLYLTLMGRMGEATGYPSVGHAVIGAEDIEKHRGHDYIVIGSGSTQALMTKWSEHLPVARVNGERQVRRPEKSWMPTYRWDQSDEDTHAASGSLALVGTGNLTVMMGLESPLQTSRSAVFLYADRPQDLRKLSDLLTDSVRSGQVRGDLAIVDDNSVTHARVAQPYTVGSLPWLSRVRWFLSDRPLLSVFVILLAVGLLAAVCYRVLKSPTKQTKKVLLP